MNFDVLFLGDKDEFGGFVMELFEVWSLGAIRYENVNTLQTVLRPGAARILVIEFDHLKTQISEFVEKMNLANCPIPVLLLSGNKELSEQLKSLGLNSNIQVLSKPFPMIDLKEKLFEMVLGLEQE